MILWKEFNALFQLKKAQQERAKADLVLLKLRLRDEGHSKEIVRETIRIVSIINSLLVSGRSGDDAPTLVLKNPITSVTTARLVNGLCNEAGFTAVIWQDEIVLYDRTKIPDNKDTGVRFTSDNLEF